MPYQKMDPDYIVVLTNLPDSESAHKLARQLVEVRLAACVNVLGPCTSIYHWQEKIETEKEVPLIIKAKRAHYGLLEQAIRESHPYEVPEIIALPVVEGLPAYLNWIGQVSSTAGSAPSGS
jgi:periplasmic divalent cation tolerance protein